MANWFGSAQGELLTMICSIWITCFSCSLGLTSLCAIKNMCINQLCSHQVWELFWDLWEMGPWAQLVQKSGFPSLVADEVYQQLWTENHAVKTVKKEKKTGNVKLSIGYLLVPYYNISTLCKGNALCNFEIVNCSTLKISLIGTSTYMQKSISLWED